MKNLSVENLRSPRTGTKVANQFHIMGTNEDTFQSYDSRIFAIDWITKECRIYPNWNYSITTKKYFKQFLSFFDMEDMYEIIKKANGQAFDYENSRGQFKAYFC